MANVFYKPVDYFSRINQIRHARQCLNSHNNHKKKQDGGEISIMTMKPPDSPSTIYITHLDFNNCL